MAAEGTRRRASAAAGAPLGFAVLVWALLAIYVLLHVGLYAQTTRWLVAVARALW